MTGPVGIYLGSCEDCDYWLGKCLIAYEWKTCPRRDEDPVSEEQLREWLNLPSLYEFQKKIMRNLKKDGWK